MPQVWSTRGVEGVHRFLARVWRVWEQGLTEELPTKEQLRLLHATIKKVRCAPQIIFDAIYALLQSADGDPSRGLPAAAVTEPAC